MFIFVFGIWIRVIHILAMPIYKETPLWQITTEKCNLQNKSDWAECPFELELELIQTQMTQKPMLRAEVYARALHASQNRKENSV